MLCCSHREQGSRPKHGPQGRNEVGAKSGKGSREGSRSHTTGAPLPNTVKEVHTMSKNELDKTALELLAVHAMIFEFHPSTKYPDPKWDRDILARRKGFACILFSLAGTGKQNIGVAQCAHWTTNAPPGRSISIRIPSVYTKSGLPTRGNPLFGTP